MTEIRRKLIELLWHGADPFPSEARNPADLQGWNSHHAYLRRAIIDVQPQIIVEVGVWKGGSVITMANVLRELKLNAAIVAVDTFLGSSEHWLDKAASAHLRHEAGYPTLFHTFVANVIENGLQDYIVPLPLDSINAFAVLKRLRIEPDVLHIDAGHDFRSVTNDLTAWWSVLPPGGVLVGDDYFADGSIWPEVRNAFDAFFGKHEASVFESGDAKCYVKKPIAPRQSL